MNNQIMLSRSDLCLSKLMNKHTFDNKNQCNNVITIYKNFKNRSELTPSLHIQHMENNE